ncbi:MULTISPECIES: GNAT family N-acetyltransferase [Galbibacter]|uniref:GNAT family protein n=1 Tax=Galbibacter pacificus TaxID=2996052 RepID=A0ABT6FQL4_9FLAO|nr:GNAT family protein [Galbibacter pacificus]MDG3581966.1 GNAT family protein [Galbibacter pacificus]MDG3585560.1 GNAT family protein [Galbibacter pacificus]
MNIPTLENEIVKLSPLTMENYKNLYAISSEKDLLQYSPSNISTLQALIEYVQTAIDLARKNEAVPFIILDKRTDRYAGSTRYMNIDWENKVLHIGATWIGRDFHGNGLNTAMKQLMLDYAFFKMNFEKVEFRIDERNIRSRKAVEKLGAKLEGILRKNVYLINGFKRNTCCYGILKEEWIKKSN